MIALIKRFINWLLSLFGFGSKSADKGVGRADDDSLMGQNARRPKNPYAGLTAQQAYEKSWEFLNVIAEKVKRFFSKPDQEQLKNLGRTLFQSGTKYIHQAPSTEPEKRKQVAVGKDKTQSRQR